MLTAIYNIIHLKPLQSTVICFVYNEIDIFILAERKTDKNK